jgi:molybdopterin biosynthesis enzyme
VGFTIDMNGERPLEFHRIVICEGQVLSSVSWANALAVIPPETTVARGDPIELLLLDQLSR